MPSPPRTRASSDAPQLAVLTFNLLAPCYKRLHHSDGTERPDRERDHHAMWTSRLEAILAFIREIRPYPDVIALQEVWFNDEYLATFEAALSPDFHFFYQKRPDNKRDGLATLIRRDSCALSNPRVEYAGRLADSDRVALGVSVDVATPGAAVPARLLVVNTHLTFPHGPCTSPIRLAQADALVDLATAKADPNAPSLILGDFNSNNNSRVARRLRRDRFVNCYTKLNGEGASPSTHHNHCKQNVFVDHMFLRAPSAAPDPPRDPFSSDESGSDDEIEQTPRSPPRGKYRRSESALRVEDAPFDSDSPPSPPLPTQFMPAGITVEGVAELGVSSVGQQVTMLRPVSSKVYPEDLPVNQWPSSYVVSDHRPVGIVFQPVARAS